MRRTPRCAAPTPRGIGSSAVARACIADDIWDIRQNGLTWDNGLALAADVGGLLLPGLTGVGMVVRGGRAAKAAAEAASHGDDAARLAGRITTRAVGEGAQRFVLEAAQKAEEVVAQKRLLGSVEKARGKLKKARKFCQDCSSTVPGLNSVLTIINNITSGPLPWAVPRRAGWSMRGTTTQRLAESKTG